MGFKDFLVKWFYEEVEAEDDNMASATISNSSLPIYNGAPEDNSKIIIDNKLDSIISNLNVDVNNLPLDKIKTEVQIINNIIEDLIQDLDTFKQNENRRDELSSVISARVKNITVRGLALRDLLVQINDNYYIKLIEFFKTKNYDIGTDLVNKNKIIIDELLEKLGNLVVYDYKMNSEKNTDFLNAINTDAENFKDYLGVLKELLYINLLELNSGLRAKVNNIETLRQELV